MITRKKEKKHRRWRKSKFQKRREPSGRPRSTIVCIITVRKQRVNRACLSGHRDDRICRCVAVKAPGTTGPAVPFFAHRTRRSEVDSGVSGGVGPSRRSSSNTACTRGMRARTLPVGGSVGNRRKHASRRVRTTYNILYRAIMYKNLHTIL